VLFIFLRLGMAAGSSCGDTQPPGEEEDDEETAAAEARMKSIQRGFAAAKSKGVQAATRLMKELRQVCLTGSFDVELVDDSLQVWEVTLFDWAFDAESSLHKDLQALSESSDDLVPVVLRIHFPDDFPFAAPLLYISRPTLRSEFIFDGALCLEMLVDWAPQYGNVEAMLVQVCAFLASSGARVEKALPLGEGSTSAQAAATRESAQRAYEHLKAFHDKKGWSQARQ